MSVRRAVHAMGLRYRVHMRPVRDVRREADLVFGPSRVAVFVDGCFWHRCPDHGTSPQANAAWWADKLGKNQERDLDTTRRLTEAGWTVFRIWEHEDPTAAALRIAQHVRSSAPPRGGS